MDTRTIKILKATVCGGLPVSPGDVVDASTGDAHYLINTQAAEPFEKPVAEKPKAERKLKNKMISSKTLEVRA